MAENFGRGLRLTDPDGVTIQIQELDTEVMRRSEAALQDQRIRRDRPAGEAIRRSRSPRAARSTMPSGYHRRVA
ncbi:hypothetical protein AB0H42_02955 [Nocardia sp. NPDC050799]|uniref:hypothetical protein n=1 Tax=Nocardia sp. NPDC050799 TaxID=3154842 RepID=UPI0033CACC9A